MLDTAEIIFLKLASSAVRGLEFVRVKRRMDRAGHCRKKFWFFSSISHKHLTILATHMGLYASWSGSFSPLHIDQLKEEEFVDQLRWMINRFALPHLQELHGFFWAAPRWSVCRVRVARNSFHPAISRRRGFEMVELAY